MPDDTQTIIEPRTDLVPAHLSDTGKDGQPKAAQLRVGSEIAPIIPTTLEEAYRYAVAVIKAGLAPSSYNVGGNGPDKDDADPQKVLIGILKGMEVGLPPITALSTIAIINKRPTIWGDGAVALVQSRGIVDKIEAIYEGGEERSGANEISPADYPDTFACVYRIWRRGQANPYEGRFSVKDAKRAHLWNNTKREPWMKYPKRMLLARARAFALRDGFSDALAGLSIREEVEDLPAPPPPKVDTSFLDDAPTPAALPAPTETPILHEAPEPKAAESVPAEAPIAAPKAKAEPKRQAAPTLAFEPPSPIKFPEPGVIKDWGEWALEQITTMPREEIGGFLAGRKEFDVIAERNTGLWDRIQAAADDRRAEG